MIAHYSKRILALSIKVRGDLLLTTTVRLYQVTQPVTMLGITQQRAHELKPAKILSCPAFLVSLFLGYENQVTPCASGSKSESHDLLLLLRNSGAGEKS